MAPIGLFVKIDIEHPEKLNVCAGINENRVVGLFLPVNLTEKMYFQLLQNTVNPGMKDIIKHNDPYYKNDSFQQASSLYPCYW